MQKYYHGDAYRLVNEDEFFSSKLSMIEYLKDNWEDYVFPIGDDYRLISIEEDQDDNYIQIEYETTDYEAEKEPKWIPNSHSIEYDIIQMTSLVAEL